MTPHVMRVSFGLRALLLYLDGGGYKNDEEAFCAGDGGDFTLARTDFGEL